MCVCPIIYGHHRVGLCNIHPSKKNISDVLNPENSVDPLVENYIQDIVAKETPGMTRPCGDQRRSLFRPVPIVRRTAE